MKQQAYYLPVVLLLFAGGKARCVHLQDGYQPNSASPSRERTKVLPPPGPLST